MIKSIYVIGSLRNPDGVLAVGNKLRSIGLEAFDDWVAPGPEADDWWKKYEQARGHTYLEALNGWAAKHVFEFDKSHLDRCDAAVLVCPAGKSCHLEFGYTIGKGKPGWILLDDPDRWDVMVQFATGWHTDIDELVKDIDVWNKKANQRSNSSEFMQQALSSMVVKTPGT